MFLKWNEENIWLYYIKKDIDVFVVVLMDV